MKPTRLETTDEAMFGAHTFWNAQLGKREDLAHWLGRGRWGRRRWLKHGQANLRLWRDLVKRFGHLDTEPRGRLLEWGCGGGANVVAFAEEFVDHLPRCEAVEGVLQLFDGLVRGGQIAAQPGCRPQRGPADQSQHHQRAGKYGDNDRLDFHGPGHASSTSTLIRASELAKAVWPTISTTSSCGRPRQNSANIFWMLGTW